MDHKKYDREPVAADKAMRNGNGRPKSPKPHIWSPNGKPISRPSWIANSPNLPMLAYCVTAVSLALATKYAVSGLYWNINFFLIFVQSSIAVLVMGLLRLMGIIPAFPAFDWRKALWWAPLSLLLVVKGYLTLKALQCLSLPTYTILTNLETMAIAYTETTVSGASTPGLTTISFGLMTLGCAGALWTDYDVAMGSYGDRRLIQTLEPNDPVLNLLVGSVLMLACILIACVHAVIMRRINRTTNFKDWEVTWYNNLLIIPISATLSHLIEDFSTENMNDNFPSLSKTPIILSILSMGILTALVPYTSTLLKEKNLSLTTPFNKFPTAIFGAIIFREKETTMDSYEAIMVASCGAVLYAWSRLKQMAKERKESLLPTSSFVRNGGREGENRDFL